MNEWKESGQRELGRQKLEQGGKERRERRGEVVGTLVGKTRGREKRGRKPAKEGEEGRGGGKKDDVRNLNHGKVKGKTEKGGRRGER